MSTEVKLDAIYVELNTKLTRYKKEFASEFAQRVAEKTPVETGRLKAGWVTKTTASGFELSNTQDYAGFVEYGTEKMAPRAMVGRTLVEKEQISDVARQRAGLK